MDFGNRLHRRFAGLAGLVGLLCASCGQAPHEADGWRFDQAAPQATPDAASAEPDAESAEPDADQDEPPAPDSPPVEPLEFDPELWDESNPCGAPVTYEAPPQTFSLPDEVASSTLREMTREELLRWTHGLDEGDAGAKIRLGASTNPGPNSERDYNMFVEPGTAIPIHIYPYNGGALDDFRFSVTVLVDYEPVEAVYTRWNAERTEKLDETTTTGVSDEFRSDVEILDVTIPAEVFEERRMYEIAVSVDLNSVTKGSRRNHRRYALYNGGYKRPDRPCAETSIEQAVTSVERHMLRERRRSSGVLFFDGIPSDYDWHDTFEVAPGETRQFYFSATHNGVYGFASDVVFVPVLDARPIGPAWWVHSLPRSSGHWPTVDDRKSFEVTFPAEPGVYDVQVLHWAQPFELARNIFGTEVEGVSDGGGLSLSSNALRFVVRP